MVVNVVTVHNYGRGANNESDVESPCEHATHMIEEISMDMVSDATDEIILQGSKNEAQDTQLINILTLTCTDTAQITMQVLDDTITLDQVTNQNDSQANSLKC